MPKTVFRCILRPVKAGLFLRPYRRIPLASFPGMIESTLRFDDVEVIPGLLPLLWVVQRSHMQSSERSGRQPGNKARIPYHLSP